MISTPIPLCEFGCTCFVHYLSPGKDKLSAKALKCIFLSYSQIQKGYHCFFPSFHDTLFPPMSHSLKTHHFSMPLCYLMRMVLYMLEISLSSFPCPLHLHFRSTCDRHPIRRRLEMILIHQHHLLLQLLLQLRHLHMTFQ